VPPITPLGSAGKSNELVVFCAYNEWTVQLCKGSFAAIIRCTADPAKADKRTRSKWSRAMRYATVYKPGSEPLAQFIRRKGGINACAARFTRWLGRTASSRTAE
jgi:hypothetical protein